MTRPLDKKSTPEQIRARFDQDVERFSNLETGQQATMDALLMMALVAEAAAACTPNAQHVLDIGCGAGNYLLKLLEWLNPLDCDLIDLSRPMLDRAQERIAAVNSGRIRTFQKDIREVNLASESYDIVIAAAVFHHLRDDQDWQQVFTKIYTGMAPGGSVWIADLVGHANPDIQNMMWKRYGEYLESLGGRISQECL